MVGRGLFGSRVVGREWWGSRGREWGGGIKG